MGEFALALDKFKRKVLDRYDFVVRKLVLDVGTSLVYKSPVGDAKYWKSPAPKGYVGGRFRANWQLAVGKIDYVTTDKVDASGASTIAGFAAMIGPAPAGSVYYYTNSLPYAKRIEEGWSRQAPEGMVRLTFLEWQNFVNQAVGEAKAEI